MKFIAGGKVRVIPMVGGHKVIATLHKAEDGITGKMWWVQYKINSDVEEFALFLETDIVMWNKCSCGALKIKSTIHSNWCDQIEGG
jgi:hypothetical protein